ncbi:MAG: hypothetical protein ACTSRU_17930 [Candidatus Hodarchaeales archaeon]
MSSVVVKISENGKTKSVIGETEKEAMKKAGYILVKSTTQEVFESVTVGEVNDG